MTDGAYVSRTQQHGYLLPLSTASCEQTCRERFAAAEGYRSCLAECPDVGFVDRAVCAPAHRTLCVADSRFDGTRTSTATFSLLGIAAFVLLSIMGTYHGGPDGSDD